MSPCRCGGHGGYSGHGGDHHHKEDKRSDERKIRLVNYRQGDHKGDKPQGYHPPEWWKERGYSLKKNTFKDRDGEYRGAKSPELNKKKKDKR